MNDFQRDDEFQREMRDLHLTPFYERLSGGKFFYIDPPPGDDNSCAMWIQREIGVDTLLKVRGKTVGVEEKIVRWPERDAPYTAYTLETMSCTNPGYEKDGWIYSSVADKILYAFIQRDGSMLAHIIPMVELKKWCFNMSTGSAFPNAQKYRIETYPRHVEEDKNRSESYVVPISDVWGGVKGCIAYKLNEGEIEPVA